MAHDKEEAAIPGDAAPDETIAADDSASAPGELSDGESADPEIDEPPAPTDPPIQDSPPAETETDLPASIYAAAVSDPSEPNPAPASGTDPGTTGAQPELALAAAAAANEPPRKIRRILPARSSTAIPGSSVTTTKQGWTRLRKLTVAALVAWVLVLIGLGGEWALGKSDPFSIGIYLVAVVVAGIFPAIELVRRGRQFAVPASLIPLVAALGALVAGFWREAAVLLACYVTLMALQELILRRSEEPIEALVAARPTQAILAGAVTPLPIKEVTVGDTVQVGKGEIIPVDGFVETGSTAVDQAIVTGSSTPAEKQRGSDVYAGSRNLGADIDVRVARRPSQRTIARAARLAKNALPHPSRAQQMLEELAGKYAIAMLLVALLAFIVLVTIGDFAWRSAMERTVAFLVAASPAALILAAPVAYRAAMANAIRHGVLFRGQDELETLGTVKTIAFDKTGTLTAGKPVVTGVVNCNTGWTDSEILQRAAAAELRSDHRLGGAIVNAAEAGELEIPDPAAFTPSPGKGIVATVGDRTVAVGNANLFAELEVNIWRAIEISADMRDEGQSAVLVGDRENVRGVIGVSDPLRPEAPEIVADLGNLKIRRTAMLTGDDEVVANVIATEAGLREVYADLLPEEKLGVVRQMEQSAPVGMIAGAGENSPTLAIATSGIALGSVSSDVTREPAGVLLFGGELSELPFALWISQVARRTTNAGIILIISVMAVLATGALVVGIPLMAVILISFVVALLVMLAALRLFGLQRRMPRRRATAEVTTASETSIDAIPLPKPRYVIDDDDDEDDL